MNSDRAAPRRIFIATLAHETNTFSPLPTTLRSFGEGMLHRRGDPALAECSRAYPINAGFFAEAEARGDTLVPGLCTWAQPAGPVSRGDYEALRDELLADLQTAGPVDAVLLVLHGAMVAQGYPDCEGDLLGRVRALVGPRTPVGALLDLHGNVTPAMVDSGALLVACKEYPHTDYTARGRELYAIVAAACECDAAMPRTVMRRVPMLGIFGTTDGPMRGFVQRLKDCESLPGILSVSAMHGFPWSDTEHTSASIVVVAADGQAAAADALAGQLAAEFFELRKSAQPRLLSVDDAISAALAASRPDGPVVLSDGADNPGGGAACDSTFVLQALLDRQVRDVALGMIWDPQAVAIATDAGVGARLPLRIGGKVGPLSGAPVDLLVEVLACRSDVAQTGVEGEGKEALGAAVAVRAQGIDIVLNSIRQQVFSPDCFTELGIALTGKRLVVVKSTQHFRAGFDPLAVATIYCDAPGSLNSDLASLPYQHLKRPMWPMDAITSPATPAAGSP